MTSFDPVGWCSKQARTLASKVIREGNVPSHVALIMDGNRRFARQRNLKRIEGHSMGFDKLKETLEWCLDLDIRMVTVYAFSIENFKRSKDEVDSLMRLAEDSFKQLLSKTELLHKHEVSVRVLGRVELLPIGLQRQLGKAVHVTRNYKRAVLNVCFAYTSRDEICTAMNEMAQGVKSGLLEESDLTEDLLTQCLYTEQAPRPGLLVRSSGEVRLSDFLHWQCGLDSVIVFTPVLWPDFSFWHLLAGVVQYQLQQSTANRVRIEHAAKIAEEERLEDEAAILAKADAVISPSRMVDLLRERRQKRLQRQASFLKELYSRREAMFARLAAEEEANDLANAGVEVAA